MNPHKVPSEDIVHAFGGNEAPILLEGGQRESYRVGDVVIKPVDDEESVIWSAEIMSTITENGFRVARPVKAVNGSWVYQGWHGFSYIEGEAVKGRVTEKIQVSRLFHQELATYPKPSFLDSRNSPWAIADRMVWGSQPMEYRSRLAKVMILLKNLLKPIGLPAQLIHGDMTGNILFHKYLPPAIIDFSPYWRPAEFATAIIIVDSMVWDGAEDNLMNEIASTIDMNQLLVRATMWRIKSTEECIKQFGVGSIEDVDAYMHLINLIQERETRQTNDSL